MDSIYLLWKETRLFCQITLEMNIYTCTQYSASISLVHKDSKLAPFLHLTEKANFGGLSVMNYNSIAR
jgi:hypothetical protein